MHTKETINKIVKNKDEVTYLGHPENSPFYKKSNTSFGSALVNVIYPACEYRPEDTHNYTLRLEYNPKGGQVSYKDAYHILLFGGNTGPASSAVNKGTISNFAKDANAIVHMIEMPGVLNIDSGLRSDGLVQNQSHLIKAGILQVEYLISKGADPEKILLLGRSLGGAIATITAAHCHSQGKKVFLFNHTSFSSISAVATEWVNRLLFENCLALTGIIAFAYNASALFSMSFNHNTKVLSMALNLCVPSIRTLGTTALASISSLLVCYVLARPIVWSVLYFTNWEMDAGKAYLSIPKAFKRMSYLENDEVITDAGGLYNVDPEELSTDQMVAYQGGHNQPAYRLVSASYEGLVGNCITKLHEILDKYNKSKNPEIADHGYPDRTVVSAVKKILGIGVVINEKCAPAVWEAIKAKYKDATDTEKLNSFVKAVDELLKKELAPGITKKLYGNYSKEEKIYAVDDIAIYARRIQLRNVVKDCVIKYYLDQKFVIPDFIKPQWLLQFVVPQFGSLESKQERAGKIIEIATESILSMLDRETIKSYNGKCVDDVNREKNIKEFAASLT